MSETIPLFPLRSVLFPLGRMPLQIFEPRYLDLVSSSLKNDSGFGVVWLSKGTETVGGDSSISHIGCYAKIVDWDSLANKLLGITIEGQRNFRILTSCRESNYLTMAEVEWLEPEPCAKIPQDSGELQLLLCQLLQHPHIERLKYDESIAEIERLSSKIHDASSLGYLLAQLLPLDEPVKYRLLVEADPTQRLNTISSLLKHFSE